MICWRPLSVPIKTLAARRRWRSGLTEPRLWLVRPYAPISAEVRPAAAAKMNRPMLWGAQPRGLSASDDIPAGIRWLLANGCWLAAGDGDGGGGGSGAVAGRCRCCQCCCCRHAATATTTEHAASAWLTAVAT